MGHPMNGADAREALIGECDSAIEQIQHTRGTRACEAHDPLARGMIVVLRCSAAQLRREAESARDARSKRGDIALWLAKVGLRAVLLMILLSVAAWMGASPAIHAWLAKLF